ncbi:MAG: YraN family protein [Actinobacteria bacterium]|nr:YraN family protein [Actinomycetota bacterium]
MREERGSASSSLVGTAGEAAAAAHYRQAGYRVLARNWRCRLGEIDLVLFRGRTLIVCEVKARRGSALGGPFEAVTRAKQRKLRLLAETFLIASSIRPPEVRFDVASVMIDPGGTPRVHVFEHAF